MLNLIKMSTFYIFYWIQLKWYVIFGIDLKYIILSQMDWSEIYVKLFNLYIHAKIKLT